MKKALLFISIIIIPALLSAQQDLGQINVSKWKLFSVGNNKQLKKIDDSTMYAYYRTSLDESGIMIFDKSMKVTRDIPLELTKNKKIVFSAKAFAQVASFPYTFYRPDARAVVIVAAQKNDKKDYSVVGITYSIDGAGLLDVQELAKASSDDFIIRYSENEAYMLVAELTKKQKGKGYTVIYNVFDKECQKVYSAEGDLLKGGDNYFRLLNTGELIHYSIKEEGRKITYLFTKFDASGTSVTAAFAPPKTDIYNYDGFSITKTDNGEFFASCMKYRTKAEGLAILKIDFENKTVKKITDKNFDKPGLAKLNAVKTKSIAMVGKKLEPVKDFSSYSIYTCSADNENIYLVLEDFYSKTVTSKTGTRITYGSDGLIVACYSHDGKEKWIAPIKRRARHHDTDINLFNGNGRSIAISSYETSEDFCFLVKSQDKTYYTKVNKKTGKDIEPVLLLDDKSGYTNSNCMGWFDDDEVVVLSLKGTFVLSKDNFWLKGFRIGKIAI